MIEADIEKILFRLELLEEKVKRLEFGCMTPEIATAYGPIPIETEGPFSKSIPICGSCYNLAEGFKSAIDICSDCLDKLGFFLKPLKDTKIVQRIIPEFQCDAAGCINLATHFIVPKWDIEIRQRNCKECNRIFNLKHLDAQYCNTAACKKKKYRKGLND